MSSQTPSVAIANIQPSIVSFIAKEYFSRCLWATSSDDLEVPI